MHVTVLGIDLGKNSCSVVGLDEAGRVVLRRRMRRDGVVRFVERLSPCTVAMEACCGAHHLGRELACFGHAVRLMSPEYVRPYVKAHKNDDRDAEAIAEAATRPTMRFVEIKSQEHLDLQTLHRSRSRLVSERTADQPAPRHSAGARNRRCTRPPQAGAASGGDAGRWRGARYQRADADPD